MPGGCPSDLASSAGAQFADLVGKWVCRSSEARIGYPGFSFHWKDTCIRAGSRGGLFSRTTCEDRFEDTAERYHSTPKAGGVKANYCGEGVNAVSDGAFAC
jgi:hypothetical protein